MIAVCIITVIPHDTLNQCWWPSWIFVFCAFSAQYLQGCSPGLCLWVYVEMISTGQPFTGLANCRYVAHQSDRQGQNATKGYSLLREKKWLEIAHIHVDRVQNRIVWMQSDPRLHRPHTGFFLLPILISVCRAQINATFGQPCFTARHAPQIALAPWVYFWNYVIFNDFGSPLGFAL